MRSRRSSTSTRSASTGAISTASPRLSANAELRSTRHDRVRRGTAEARELYDAVILYDDGTPGTVHQLTNVTVTVDGPTATARSYFTVLQVTGQGLHPILVGEYRDRFAVVDGGWEFTERIFDPRLFGDLSKHIRSVSHSMTFTAS